MASLYRLTPIHLDFLCLKEHLRGTARGGIVMLPFTLIGRVRRIRPAHRELSARSHQRSLLPKVRYMRGVGPKWQLRNPGSAGRNKVVADF
jgi:hypothetical protein